MKKKMKEKKKRNLEYSNHNTLLMECIVVLGAPLQIVDGEEVPGVWLEKRLLEAIKIYQKKKSMIVVTGSNPNSVRFEGDIMKEYLIKSGVKSEHIISETRAMNTVANAFYVGLILKKMDRFPTKIFLVTSSFHMTRSKKLFDPILRDGFGFKCEMECVEAEDGMSSEERKKRDIVEVRIANNFEPHVRLAIARAREGSSKLYRDD